ncbi:cbb3-type cytochrome c oxidase subunit I [Acidithiobacillus caldus]|uniref:Cytochrome o ubiquinol oxidase subunit I n=2 Tax=Acidithiobacillus caldus TaxID=33059 RepID=A0A1E7YRI4_9PROT|nr:cbb3-type cytochrome c oxidase subunit I [Acidithiobacillus caldus]OFC36282.1 cytochrome o ubiquinol oxidase subunit I [Acidithiobacillus caldus]OFC39013.1 cytochrome o ubiquinol oxidase subunit I [Acidithiobacillus caldus]OFC41358.1 cytochrome o ubiquinol oxidase subunit I [Acidithiobacillus caldus]
MLVHLQGPWNPLLGRLTLQQIPYQNPILLGTFIFVAILGVIILGATTRYGKWGYVWREWLTTVDHKKIGIMYCLVGLVMLFRGFIDALMIRTQQAIAVGPKSPGFLGAVHGYLTPFHVGQIFTAHGLIMIVFAATPLLVGIMNIIVPLQIGARDMAYPYLNALGLWLTTAGAALVMLSLFIGNFAHGGWYGFVPYFELPYSPGVGVDYWLWAFQLSVLGTTLGSINLIATIVKMRAPGMTWMRMPIFTWASLSANLIALTSFPVLMVALALLGMDRYLGTHFYTAGMGGNLMLYNDLFWVWGHPEVYFLILPAFGMMSEIIPTFSEKTLFGYATMVIASFAIGGVSWGVWLHHFFTMAAAPSVNSFYSVSTMLVGIPTGVKVFNWIFTMYRGRVRYELPMMWALLALFLLLVGGMTGMMNAFASSDYMWHNGVFVVAHFHMMVLLIAASVFGAVEYWFPKVFGFKLEQKWGKWFFWFMVLGTGWVFVPMFILGIAGMTRRLDYIPYTQWAPYLHVMLVGMAFYVVAVGFFVAHLYVSLRDREKNRVGADAWGTTRNLEWMTHSPVPAYNFAFIPHVNARDEWAWRKEHGLAELHAGDYEDIHMPKNTGVPLFLGIFSMGLAFALVWRIWWLALLCLALIVALIIIRSFDRDTDTTIPAQEVDRVERAARDGVTENGPASDLLGDPVVATSSIRSESGGMGGKSSAAQPAWAPMDR